MSTNTSSSPTPQQDAAGAADKQQDSATVTKTVHTVELRSSAGQEEGEGVLKPITVVHEIPAKEKEPVLKQD